MPRGSSADLCRAAIEGRIASQKALLHEVRAADPGPLAAEQQIDRALMVGQLEGTIFEQADKGSAALQLGLTIEHVDARAFRKPGARL